MDSSKSTQYSELKKLNPWHDDEAIVIKPIEPHRGGRIRYLGSDWPARCLQNQFIPVGCRVRVIGSHRITWFVELELAETEAMTASPN